MAEVGSNCGVPAEPTREFLHVEDAAEGILLAAEHYNSSDPVNLGSAWKSESRILPKDYRQATGFKGSSYGTRRSLTASHADRWASQRPNSFLVLKLEFHSKRGYAKRCSGIRTIYLDSFSINSAAAFPLRMESSDPVVVPTPITSGGENILPLEIFDQSGEVVLPVAVEDDIGATNIQNMPGEDAVVFLKNSAPVQIGNRLLVSSLHIDFPARSMGNLNIDRTRVGRRNVF